MELPLLHWPCWTSCLQPIGSAWLALLLAVAVGGWPIARSSAKGSAELAGCVGSGSCGSAAGGSICWRLCTSSSGSTSMGCTLSASACGCLVAMLWLLLALLLLVWGTSGHQCRIATPWRTWHHTCIAVSVASRGG